MRKLLVLMTVLIFLLVGCTLSDSMRQAPDGVTEEWQTITITGIVSFRVPSEWYVEEEEGILYLTDRPRADEDYVIHMVGAGGALGFSLYELFEGIEEGRLLRSRIFSAGGAVSLSEYTVNGVMQEHYTISYSIPSRQLFFRLFGWNREVVDEWHADQIARTVRGQQ